MDAGAYEFEGTFIKRRSDVMPARVLDHDSAKQYSVAGAACELFKGWFIRSSYIADPF